ncbi:hypothetical protein N2152v2_010618 [Parachlorella kessleri]
MLQRKPTRIELKPEDKEEYDAIKREQQQAALQAAAQRQDKQPLSPLFTVEVKLRLAGAEAHAKLAKALQASYRITHEQENFFFDGSKQELSSQRVVLRVRFYGIDKKAVITLKGRQVLKDGIGRAPEEEEGVDPLQARVFLTDPSRLLHLDIPLMAKLRESYPSMEGLVSLGGFKNTRQEFDWQEHLLELDETKYEWGTLYELECETTEPEKLRQELEAFLGEQGVAYKYSTTTKFANFRNRTLE